MTRGATAIGLVFALLGVSIWVLRALRRSPVMAGTLGQTLRRGSGRRPSPEESSPIQIINQQALAPGKSLLVVGVGRDRFLLSLTADRLEMVASLGAADPSPARSTDAPEHYPDARNLADDPTLTPSARSRIRAKLEGLKHF